MEISGRRKNAGLGGTVTATVTWLSGKFLDTVECFDEGKESRECHESDWIPSGGVKWA